jgi:hypothetical protein
LLIKSLDELDFDDSNGQVRYQHLNIGYISTYQSSHQKILMPDSSNWTHILIKYESTSYQLNQLSLIELFSLTAGLRCTILSVHNPNKLLDNYLKLLFFFVLQNEALVVSLNFFMFVKKSHIGYELAWTRVYKWVTILILQDGFVMMS